MKNVLFGLLSILIWSCNSDDDSNSVTEFKIGEVGPAGGRVIYDAGNYNARWRYIETAPNDLEGYEWGCFNSPYHECKKYKCWYWAEKYNSNC